MKSTEIPQKGERKHSERKDGYMVDLCPPYGQILIHEFTTGIGLKQHLNTVKKKKRKKKEEIKGKLPLFGMNTAIRASLHSKHWLPAQSFSSPIFYFYEIEGNSCMAERQQRDL